MIKLIGLACTILLLFPSASPQRSRFSAYKAVEAYEIRPGILMMPRYSDDGQVCEIVVEKTHYLNGTAMLNSTIPRDVFIQIADELAPTDERGPLAQDWGTEYISAYAGNSVSTYASYKNLSIIISGINSPKASAGDFVEVIHWTNRKCK